MRLTWLLLLSLLMIPSLATADEIYFTDGSKVVGTIEELGNGKIKIKTDFAGELTVDAKKVKGLTTKTTMAVELKSGERAIGPLQYTSNGNQMVQGSTPRQVKMDSVTAVWQSGEESPAEEAAQAKREAQKWQYHLELGLNGETGASEMFALNGAGAAKRTTDDQRLTFYGNVRFARQNGQNTTRDVVGGINLENDITKNLYWFVHGELENNEFQNLELRATIAAGLGYYLINTPHEEFKIHGGPGYEHESFYVGPPDESDHVVLELGEEYHKDFEPWLTFLHDFTIYPDMERIKDYRFVLNDAGEIPITPDRQWKFKLGMKNQYESMPGGGAARLDTSYFANIVVDFK